jgi:hypothetical protein
MAASSQSDLEVALEKAKPKLNKVGKASAENALKQLGKANGNLEAMFFWNEQQVSCCHEEDE